jgi:hypothetical protein
VRRWWIAAALLALTVGQLAVGAFGSLEQFEGKAFGARLVAYPLVMVAVPLAWLVWGSRPLPWGAFALLMAPFAIDVTGNTLDLYDRIGWWDDANHAVNWFLLSLGAGLLIARAGVRPLWALGLLVAGFGALTAIGWELAEWFTFIRHGTELDTAYTDTLGDEALGSLGAIAAAAVLVARVRR